jgi:hydrogenase nickel incorporation protein HypB
MSSPAASSIVTDAQSFETPSEVGLMKPDLTISATKDDLAAMQNRQALRKANVLAVALVGPPGAGKTALLEATARQLRGHAKVAVITVNPAAERDADRVSRYCDQVQAVKAAAPDARAIRPAIQRLDLARTEVLFIESLGGISGPPDFGQDATVSVLAVSGGDDKAAEYASLLTGSQALILSKAELQRHVIFDRGAFRSDVRRINPLAELMEISAFENSGLNRWLAWLDRRRQEKDPAYHPATLPPPLAEWFLG